MRVGFRARAGCVGDWCCSVGAGRVRRCRCHVSRVGYTGNRHSRTAGRPGLDLWCTRSSMIGWKLSVVCIMSSCRKHTFILTTLGSRSILNCPGVGTSWLSKVFIGNSQVPGTALSKKCLASAECCSSDWLIPVVRVEAENLPSMYRL
jgi:hypothetical protein